MTLFSKRKKQSDALKVRLIDRPVTHLRSDEFRADKELAHLAATILANPNFQLMLSVLRNDHPCHDVLGPTANPNDRLVQQARGEGYEICLATLESLGIKANIPERLVSTFTEDQAAETG